MITNVFCIFAYLKIILMKKILILILSFCFLNTNAQLLNKIKNEKPSSTNIFAEISLLEVEWSDENQQIVNENISTYIAGVSANMDLNKKLSLVGSFGVSEGFSFNFLTSNLLYNLSDNFGIFYGVGTYYISDERWNTQGLDGNEPSRYDFGMNMGIQLSLGKYLGITMKYNMIEEKEENISSMSINGLSFGIILK